MARADSTVRVNIIGDARSLQAASKDSATAIGGIGKAAKLAGGAIALGLATDAVLDFSQTALSEAKHFRPDLMLLDVMMPDLDGFQTVKRFRADRDGAMTPVIFVSAATGDLTPSDRRLAEGVVAKPFRLEQLIGTIDRASGRES